MFIMDIKENGSNRPKPLNSTVIGSSLRERMRASCRKWREKNQQRCREYFRNYRQKRKELALSMQESKKEMGEEEKERQRQTRSQWREKNREKCRQYVRNYRLKTKSAHQSPDLSKELKEKNKEWQKNWKERNKERCREYVRNYRRKRQLGQITMDVTPDITIEGKAILVTNHAIKLFGKNNNLLLISGRCFTFRRNSRFWSLPVQSRFQRRTPTKLQLRLPTGLVLISKLSLAAPIFFLVNE